MSVQIPAQKTPITKKQALEALWRAWLTYFGSPPPSKEALWIVAAQWALETGWGISMWNYNFGNVKSREGDGYDYQFFACGEEIPFSIYTDWKVKNPDLVQLVRTYFVNEVKYASVKVTPIHPACRFRAFHTAEEGALDHIALLVKRFPTAWACALAGDSVGYAYALSNAHYFTANVDQYLKGLQGCFKMAAEVEGVDYDSLPIMLESEKERILGMFLTMDDVLDGKD